MTAFKQQQIPNEWRKAKEVALLKPGKDPESPKSYRSIALFCSLYKLLERMVLTRLQCNIEHKIITQQAGFRLVKSCCSQVLNLTQHIEDGFELGRIISPPQIRRTVHSQNERTKQLTDQRHRLHDDPTPSPPARERPPTLSKQFHFNLPASPVYARRSPCREVARTFGANRQQSKELQRPPKRSIAGWSHAAVACMADGQPSALGTGRHPAAKHMWGYRESKNCMCGAATCDLNHIMTSCTHFGERPSVDDIAEMKDGYVRWLSAIADTT